LTDCGGGGGERAEGEEETFHELSLNRSWGREELVGLGWDGGVVVMLIGGPVKL
jgi:hypothetical protein